MALLTIKNLTVEYHTRKGLLRAVDGVDLDVQAGKSLGIVGESGCGKTTIGAAIMRLLPKNAVVSSGSIVFNGQELLTLSIDEIRAIRWQHIAMIFQAAMNALNPVHRVGEQIAEAILAHQPDMKREAALKRVAELFDLVGIAKGRQRDFPHQYSGGMKQRAIIAMALACRPDLIIADEPTTALDVIVQDQILTALGRLQTKMEIGIILISHDIGIVYDMCHDIAVMYCGQLMERGRREEVFDTPVHPYTKLLLSSYLTLAGNDVSGSIGEAENRGNNTIPIDQPCCFYARCPEKEDICVAAKPKWHHLTPTHRVRCQKAGS